MSILEHDASFDHLLFQSHDGKEPQETDYNARLKCVTSVPRHEAESVFKKQKKLTLKFREQNDLDEESLRAKMENVTW